MSEQLIAVHAVGRDRPGVVSDVIGALSPLAVYHDDPKTHLLPGGNAAVLVTIRTDVGLERVKAALEPVVSEDFDIRAVELTDHTADAAASEEDQHHFVLRIRTAGRPGVLAEFTKVVSRHGGRIVDFGTRIGGGRVSVLRVELPGEPDVDVYSTLGRDLYGLAEQMGVGIKFFDTTVGENAEMYDR